MKTKVGDKVIIRGAIYFHTGVVREITSDTIVLGEAAWVADTRRWADALATGELEEVEPFPDETEVMLASIMDITPWPHPLPRVQR
jgi:hypothetical protein